MTCLGVFACTITEQVTDKVRCAVLESFLQIMDEADRILNMDFEEEVINAY